MDSIKIGRLLARLRNEKGLTQSAVAQTLHVSNKTISKWECGHGCPDAAIWQQLSAVYGVDMRQLLSGEMMCNRPDPGNINRMRFYVCPECANILFSTGDATLFCCGRLLTPLKPVTDKEVPNATRHISDGEYYITFDHEMTREHYLLFAAYVRNDKLVLSRMYPEQDAQIRLPYENGGTLYVYCIRHGFAQIRF